LREYCRQFPLELSPRRVVDHPAARAAWEATDMDTSFLTVNISSIIVAGLILLMGFPH
jgi:hypothetical protein